MAEWRRRLREVLNFPFREIFIKLNFGKLILILEKLVLQDLDPDARSRRQDFMCASPTAQLNFHFKKLKNFNKVCNI